MDEQLWQEFRDFKEKIIRFTAGLEAWQEMTTDYRKALCEKIENILLRMDNLPCKERAAWYQSMGRQIGFMWVVLGIILSAIVGSSLKSGSERSQILKELACKHSQAER